MQNAERAHINAGLKSFIGNKHLGFYLDKYGKLLKQWMNDVSVYSVAEGTM